MKLNSARERFVIRSARACTMALIVMCAVSVEGPLAQSPSPAGALPQAVVSALATAKIPAGAVAVTVQPLDGAGLALAEHENVPMNPASTMKLVTTLAGLELLGPGYVWRTEALTSAPLREGVLHGALVLRGSGDPRLVVEDLWLLVQRIRGVGVREIRGDLLFDRSGFEPAPHDPAAFDGEGLRPYNAGPDALLLNYKAVSFHFVPDLESRQVRVYSIPALTGMTVPSSVRAVDGPCLDWRARLAGDFADPLRPQFRGAFPLSCGDRVWHVSLLTPPAYGEALFRSLWEASGGVWRGRARDGVAPSDARRLAVHESRPLAEVIRDINKFSNNVMARQLFLMIGAEVTRAPASADSARRVIGDWLIAKGLDRREFALENGAGLSRIERLTTAGLVRLLVAAYASPLMPEFISSLPLVGVDGTMRRRSGAAGSAHIKTGLLADTRAIAGYVLAASGRRYAVAAIINHPNAGAAAGALDELLNWIYTTG